MVSIIDSTAQQVAIYQLAKKFERDGDLYTAAKLMTPLSTESKQLNNCLEIRSIFYAAELWTEMAAKVIDGDGLEKEEEYLNNAAQCYDIALIALKNRAVND